MPYWSFTASCSRTGDRISLIGRAAPDNERVVYPVDLRISKSALACRTTRSIAGFRCVIPCEIIGVRVQVLLDSRERAAATRGLRSRRLCYGEASAAQCVGRVRGKYRGPTSKIDWIACARMYAGACTRFPVLRWHYAIMPQLRPS